MSHSVIMLRTCGWGPLCIRHQVAMQDTSPLVGTNHLPIRDTSWEILHTLGGNWSGGAQHGVCRCQNLITECRTECQGKEGQLTMYWFCLMNCLHPLESNGMYSLPQSQCSNSPLVKIVFNVQKKITQNILYFYWWPPIGIEFSFAYQ